MALAETAQTLIDLRMQENVSATSQKAVGAMQRLEGSAKTLGGTVNRTSNILGGTASNFALVKQAATSTGSAIAGMGTHLKNVITGPLGLIGLGAGLFSVVGFLKGATDHVQEFGRASEDLAKITGLNIKTASALVDVLDKFGITGDRQIKTIGMLEKNLGNLAQVDMKGAAAVAEWDKHHTKALTTAQKLQMTMPKLVAFQKQYGINLVDTQGKIADANTLLLRAADYFNGSATASQKAAVMAKLFGRSWQDLIPVLALGSKGIQKETADAIHLTDAQLAQLTKFRVAQRDWADSLGDLQTLIGVDLLPDLTDGLKGLTTWLEAHQTDVRKFFGDALGVAKDLGRTVTQTVIPALSALASAAKGFWGAIPAPLQDLLVKGVVADRTIKFLFGVSPIHLVTQLAAGSLSTILAHVGSQFLQKGGSPANPLWVADVNGGLGGPGGAGGGGIAGLLKLAIPVVAGLAVAAAWKAIVQDPALTGQTDAIHHNVSNLAATGSTADLQRALAGINQGLYDLTVHGQNAGFVQPLVDALYGGQINALREQRDILEQAIARANAPLLKWLQTGGKLPGPISPTGFGPGIGSVRPGTVPTGRGELAQMEGRRGKMADTLSKAEIAAGVKAAHVSTTQDIEKLRGVIRPAVHQGVKQGIGPDIEKLRGSIAKGLTTTAKDVGGDIESMRGRIAAGLGGVKSAVDRKRLAVQTHVTAKTNVNTKTTVTVSANSVNSAITKSSSYSSGSILNNFTGTDDPRAGR